MPLELVSPQIPAADKTAKPSTSVDANSCWVTYTPEENECQEGADENEYDLTMFEGGGSIQDINLTRDEYIACKEFLARMRGLL